VTTLILAPKPPHHPFLDQGKAPSKSVNLQDGVHHGVT